MLRGTSWFLFTHHLIRRIITLKVIPPQIAEGGESQKHTDDIASNQKGKGELLDIHSRNNKIGNIPIMPK